MTTTQSDMRAERSAAYGRVMRAMRDEGDHRLEPAEQDTVREAADALLFADDPLGDPDACGAVQRVEALAAKLTETGRWPAERADALVGDVVGCGLVGLEAA